MRRPGAVGLADGGLVVRGGGSGHPLGSVRENETLFTYERNVKQAFDSIVPTLKQISAVQHEKDFEQQAQRIAGCARFRVA